MLLRCCFRCRCAFLVVFVVATLDVLFQLFLRRLCRCACLFKCLLSCLSLVCVVLSGCVVALSFIPMSVVFCVVVFVSLFLCGCLFVSLLSCITIPGHIARCLATLAYHRQAIQELRQSLRCVGSRYSQLCASIYKQNHGPQVLLGEYPEIAGIETTWVLLSGLRYTHDVISATFRHGPHSGEPVQALTDKLTSVQPCGGPESRGSNRLPMLGSGRHTCSSGSK